MVDFSEAIVMRENFLRDLNIAIDKVIEEKESMDLDYDLIENVLGTMLRNVKNAEVGEVTILTPIKKEEMLKITLDFFKSIDSELHKKAIDTILQQTENIKMSIYNVHQVKNFSEEDELGLLKYTRDGNVERKNGFARVHIPTRTELNPERENLLKKDECTLADLYLIVHEIAHLFDLDLDLGKPDCEELAGGKEKQETGITRELIGEATAISFEGMLSEYLLENGIYSKAAIQEMNNLTVNSFLQDARLVYAKLLLAREKDKNGEIKLEFIEKFMRDNGFSTQYIRNMAYDIIHDSRDILYEKRYALGVLIAPTIIKKYKEEGAENLKKYLQEAKNGNFEGAMNVLGIELNEQGIKNLIINMKEQIININSKQR